MVDILRRQCRFTRRQLRAILRNHGLALSLLGHAGGNCVAAVELPLLKLPGRDVNAYYQARFERLLLVSLWSYANRAAEADKALIQEMRRDSNETNLEAYKFSQWSAYMQSVLPQQSPEWLSEHWRLMSAIAAQHAYRRKALVATLTERERARQQRSFQGCLLVSQAREVNRQEARRIYGLVSDTIATINDPDHHRRLLAGLLATNRKSAGSVPTEDTRWLKHNTFEQLLSHIEAVVPRTPVDFTRSVSSCYSRPKLTRRSPPNDWEDIVQPEPPSSVAASVLQVVSSRIASPGVEPSSLVNMRPVEAFVVNNPRLCFFGPLGSDSLSPISSVVARCGPRGLEYTSPLISRPQLLSLDLTTTGKARSDVELLEKYLNALFHSKAVLSMNWKRAVHNT